jgi:dTDP-4-amino-4,6-dideoxygalactose transaminase
MTEPLPFIDLATQRRRVQAQVEAGWRRVLEHGVYIMGPEVRELEGELAAYVGVRHAITCSSGTDALWLPILALEIGPGDAVFLPSWTFTATAEAVCLAGASPVFVDVDPLTFNIDAESLAAAIAAVRRDGKLRPRAVVPVDLFGLPADYRAIDSVASSEGVVVIADAAQSFGASQDGRRVGALARITATSFFPAKPLGCWGDGGAIFTDDDELAEVIRSIRVHGRGGGGKYDNVRVGTNARLDTLQAVVLLEKLRIFDDELERRQSAAGEYGARLAGRVTPPTVPAGFTSAWAQYTICVAERDRVQAQLKEAGIPTQVYYPRPLHLQAPYAHYPAAPGGLPVTERLKDVVLSLPMHPYLDVPTVARIADAVIAASSRERRSA